MKIGTIITCKIMNEKKQTPLHSVVNTIILLLVLLWLRTTKAFDLLFLPFSGLTNSDILQLMQRE